MTRREIVRRYLSWRFTRSRWERMTEGQRKEWIDWAKRRESGERR